MVEPFICVKYAILLWSKIRCAIALAGSVLCHAIKIVDVREEAEKEFNSCDSSALQRPDIVNSYS